MIYCFNNIILNLDQSEVERGREGRKRGGGVREGQHDEREHCKRKIRSERDANKWIWTGKLEERAGRRVRGK